MSHYRATIYFDYGRIELIMNSHNKKEAFRRLTKMYSNVMNSREVVISVKELSYEEKKLYGVER